MSSIRLKIYIYIYIYIYTELKFIYIYKFNDFLNGDCFALSSDFLHEVLADLSTMEVNKWVCRQSLSLVGTGGCFSF